MRQFSIVIRPFCTTLRAILFWIFSTLKPGVVLFSTINALTWSSARSRAQMIEMSHQGELPIHFFWPLRTHVSPSRLAVVVRPPEDPEPTRGSVKPKQPIFSQRAIGGRHFFFCFSQPPREMDPPAKPSRTPQKVAKEKSTRPPSIAIKPNRCALPP